MPRLGSNSNILTCIPVAFIRESPPLPTHQEVQLADSQINILGNSDLLSVAPGVSFIFFCMVSVAHWKPCTARSCLQVIKH